MPSRCDASSSGSAVGDRPSIVVEDDGAASGCAAVLVNYRSSHLLPLVLTDLRAQDPALAHVVVVDNFSDPVERRAAARAAEDVGARFLPMDTNVGFGAACNAGAALALERGATSLFFINPDTRLAPDVVRRLTAAVDQVPRSIASPLILRSADSSVWFRGGTLDMRAGVALHARTDDVEIDWLTGCALCLSAETWSILGGFDERFFLYWEDVELTHRLKRSGGRLLLCREAVVEHDVGGSQPASRGKSPLYFRHNLRNRLLFLGIHGGRVPLGSAVRGTGGYLRLLRRRGLGRGPGRARSWVAALRGLSEGSWRFVDARWRGPSGPAAREPRRSAR